jgi:hypothetical protein
MIISHESNYGAEYHVRVVLNVRDIEGIAEKMHAAPDRVDGRVLAMFLRTVALDAIGDGDKLQISL